MAPSCAVVVDFKPFLKFPFDYVDFDCDAICRVERGSKASIRLLQSHADTDDRLHFASGRDLARKLRTAYFAGNGQLPDGVDLWRDRVGALLLEEDKHVLAFGQLFLGRGSARWVPCADYIVVFRNPRTFRSCDSHSMERLYGPPL